MLGACEKFRRERPEGKARGAQRPRHNHALGAEATRREGKGPSPFLAQRRHRDAQQKFSQALRLAWLAILAAPTLARALDYRSVAETAVLYDAPSQKAKPLFVVAAGTPVEAVVALDAWVKVRDGKGDFAWIERRQLADKRMVQVRVERAQVRESADESARLAFEAEQDVLLELVEPGPLGWIRVRHRDGQQGFVKTAQIWGF